MSTVTTTTTPGFIPGGAVAVLLGHPNAANEGQ